MKEYSKSDLNRVKRGANRALYDVEKINNILDAGCIGYVSYVYKARAITLPMAYGRAEDTMYLHGSTGNRMLNALLEAKEASMTIMHLDALVLGRSGLHHSVNYRSATLFGTVELVKDAAEKEAGLKCFMEHMMPGRWDGIRPMHKKELDRTLVVKFTIETASAKIRAVGVQDEPEDYDTSYWAGIVPIKQIAELPIADEKLSKDIETPEHVLAYYEHNKI